MMTELAEAIFGLGMMVSSVTFMLLTIRAINKKKANDREFQAWLEGFLRSQADSRRQAEKRILQSLKGTNYEGNLGDFEIFTEPEMPPGSAVVVPLPSKKKKHWWET